MRLRKGIRRSRELFVMLLTLIALLGVMPCSFAEDSGMISADEVIHPDEIQMMFDRYIADNGLNSDLISVGYVYTATGETWYYNEDRWYYSASLYKVPLMMIYAEKEAKGELTQDSEIFGMKLSYIEDEVLTYSNNDIAYSMMLNLAEPAVCRDLFRAYTSLPDEYFSWEYRAYSYFSARFMTEVMDTLYSAPKRFPGIADRLKNAQPGHYFRLTLEDCGFEIAQKYGNYHDEDGNDWNHTAGILYTSNPVILTVMTQDADESLSLLRQQNLIDSDSDPDESDQDTVLTSADEPENEILVPDEKENNPAPDQITTPLPPDQTNPAEHLGIIYGLAASVAILLLLCAIRVLCSRSTKHHKKRAED